MKVRILFQLYYDNKSVTKSVYVSNSDDINHAKRKFNNWVKKKYKNAHTVRMIEAVNVSKK